MSTSELKLNLLERLALIQDAGLLHRLKQVFDRELAEPDGFTEEELVELQEIDGDVKVVIGYLPCDGSC